MNQKKIFSFVSLGMILVGTLLLGASFLFASTSSVHWIRLKDDTINPITAEYISQSIDRAEEENVQCLVMQLDTPGGLLASTRSIVKRMLASKVPIVVYVAPGGSRAGSAGVFITYASHVAAMAPSTNIGAAHPVDIGGGGGAPQRKEDDLWKGLQEFLEAEKKKRQEEEKAKNLSNKESARKSSDSSEKAIEEKSETSNESLEEDDSPMSSKILQDTVAFIKTLAVQRGRNVEWAIKSVTKSLSITEKEALELGVIELIAQDEKDLLIQLDGRKVTIDGKEIVLQTKDATVKYVDMDARQ
ncbi:MAG: nodulation protein NfeD, partial [Candidatus Omnitrophica bacterium]|nr:nodulation protein NfeD [Candidatus Omnitrophota bacterium]